LQNKLALKESERVVFDEICCLIRESDISIREKNLLTRVKMEIERGGTFDAHMSDLRHYLLPLIQGQQISAKVWLLFAEVCENDGIDLDSKAGIPSLLISSQEG
jgi:hypothetical protein